MQVDVEQHVAGQRDALVAEHEQERVARVAVERPHAEAGVGAPVEQRRHQQRQVGWVVFEVGVEDRRVLALGLRQRGLDGRALALVLRVLEQPDAAVPVAAAEDLARCRRSTRRRRRSARTRSAARWPAPRRSRARRARARCRRASGSRAWAMTPRSAEAGTARRAPASGREMLANAACSERMPRMDFAAAGLLDGLEGDERARRLQLLEQPDRRRASRSTSCGRGRRGPAGAAAGRARARRSLQRPEVEQRTGLPARALLRIRRLLGLPEPGPTTVFSDEDVEAAGRSRCSSTPGFSEERSSRSRACSARAWPGSRRDRAALRSRRSCSRARPSRRWRCGSPTLAEQLTPASSRCWGGVPGPPARERPARRCSAGPS